jgi:hypothetical protein
VSNIIAISKPGFKKRKADVIQMDKEKQDMQQKTLDTEQRKKMGKSICSRVAAKQRSTRHSDHPGRVQAEFR